MAQVRRGRPPGDFNKGKEACFQLLRSFDFDRIECSNAFIGRHLKKCPRQVSNYIRALDEEKRLRRPCRTYHKYGRYLTRRVIQLLDYPGQRTWGIPMYPVATEAEDAETRKRLAAKPFEYDNDGWVRVGKVAKTAPTPTAPDVELPPVELPKPARVAPPGFLEPGEFLVSVRPAPVAVVDLPAPNPELDAFLAGLEADDAAELARRAADPDWEVHDSNRNYEVFKTYCRERGLRRPDGSIKPLQNSFAIRQMLKNAEQEND